MDITKTILKFVLQSEDYPSTEVNRLLHNKYRGYIDTEYKNCTTSVGLSARGDRRYDITYIAFINYDQTVKQGIYPVVLYFRKIKKLIFAYGVSATNESNITWDWNKINIQPPQKLSDLFNIQGWEKYDKYFDSFAHSHYDLSDFVTKYRDIDINNSSLELNSFDFQHDIDTLIEQFHIMMQASNSPTNITERDVPEQTIYFGPPGTGKSFKVKEDVLNGIDQQYIFRTTFHPDTDYSSFVGCYKPIMEDNTMRDQAVIGYDSLVIKLKEYLDRSYIDPKTQKSYKNINKACVVFGFDFYNSIIAMLNENNDLHSIKSLISEAYGKDNTTYDTPMRAGMTARETMLETLEHSSHIVYKFVPQAFTNAYIKAWQNTKQPVYLVIEEINRGNCAQIFGDLFQLLDRNNEGVSEYPIKADADLAKYLKDELGKDHEGIADGKIKLPANLNIIATMNTSDQSLFPMDSAFKRRWDWEFIPIEPDCKDSQFTIDIAGKTYQWSDFIKQINNRILDLSDSEDKQLGNFFIKKDISKDEFKSKVMFYLWSEVCKDYYKSGSFFKYNDGNNEVEFTFNMLFTDKDVTILQGFMEYIGVKEEQAE